MAAAIKTIPRILHYAKYLGLVLVVTGIPALIFDPSPGSEMPLLAGLFILFVTSNKSDDERSAQLKTSSLYSAFIVAYAGKLILSNLHQHALVSFELTDINHFLILTLVLANVLFYGRLYIPKV